MKRSWSLLIDHRQSLLNFPPEAPMNWGQIDPNLNDYLSDLMQIGSTCWIPDVTDRWRKEEEAVSMYPDLSNVACNIFSIIQHGVGVEASVPFGRYVMARRHSRTIGESLRENVIARQVDRANKWIFVGTDPELDTTNRENDLELNKEVVETKLHRIANLHHFWEMWQGSQNLHSTQKKSNTQNKQMTRIGYILDTEEIIKSSWSLFQHDGAAAY